MMVYTEGVGDKREHVCKSSLPCKLMQIRLCREQPQGVSKSDMFAAAAAV
jgi:hypothetical protein